ncbi:MAG TPA: 4'-phosphopantetheinyl transferase superfamily protein [Bryobacteraceae bacterium]|nr:4'-phosphopantetheinyl transferase superfamily protein [Bryobacteraceae bacterium]
MRAWNDPAGSLPWQPEAVHVWLALMPDGAQPDSSTLSAEEKDRASRLRFERDRSLFIHHHTALRAILSGYTGQAPEHMTLTAAQGGKPRLNPDCGGWRFNLSHAGSAALVAVARGREVGVDIERVRPVAGAAAIAARFFAPPECGAMRDLPAASREAGFLACWTRKEAFIKATGEGLGRNLHSFTVPVEPADSGPWRIEGWSVLALPPPPGYIAALAVEGEPPTVHCWRYVPPE